MSWSSANVVSASAASSAKMPSESPVLPNITGTASYNVSAEPSNEVIYLDALVVFHFTGVGAAYIATRQPDRGICQITLDGSKTWSIDMYSSLNNRTEQIVFATDTLAYGEHTLSLSQFAPDGRLGYYPYLASEKWVGITPNNIAAYTRTQTTTMPGPTYYNTYSGGPDVGAVAGGVVGAVVAAVLLGLLFWYWRRERRKRKGDGSVQALKKTDEDKLPIPDDTSSADHAPHGAAPDDPYQPGAGWPYGDPYAAYRGGAYGYPAPPDPSAYSSSAAPQPAWAPLSQRSLVPPLSPPSSDYHGPRYLSTGPAGQVGSAYSPGLPDSAYHSGGASDRAPAYPHHITGSGSDSRSYAVPEL